MKNGISIYGESLSLLTDLYQLTMAYGYFKSGVHENKAIFNMFFRKTPFNSEFAIVAGLEYFIEFLNTFKFSDTDIAYLSTLTGNDGNHLFDMDFLMYLKSMKFSCTVYAVPEGSVVFAHEPLVRIEGPIIQCQLLETILLNIVNFQTLIATKAARICAAAKGQPVLEFGLRRAQGIDGGIAASRAAFIGGCSATSNVLAGKLFGIPVKGTHAHSWVMSFDSEKEAFEAYADAMPNNCTFLVDTYNTIEGVRQAIRVAHEKNVNLTGIRLDSGNLAELSIQARRMLDQAGFSSTKIIASNDLDERAIQSLKSEGSKIDIWGVGTKLITAYDQPALGGVYKLSAINKNGRWDFKMKISEQWMKISNPGVLQVRRYSRPTEYVGDVIYDEDFFKIKDSSAFGVGGISYKMNFDSSLQYENLLKPIFINGELVYDLPSLNSIAEKTQLDILMIDQQAQYFVGLETNLHNYKKELIAKTQKRNS